jgi:hypothetical protein
MGVHLMGVYLTDVHLIGVYFIGGSFQTTLSAELALTSMKLFD